MGGRGAIAGWVSACFGSHEVTKPRREEEWLSQDSRGLRVWYSGHSGASTALGWQPGCGQRRDEHEPRHLQAPRNSLIHLMKTRCTHDVAPIQGFGMVMGVVYPGLAARALTCRAYSPPEG